MLDPACGSGNFLYVSLEHLKRLEGEVLDVAAQFGESFKLELETHTVDPHQFLGLEINPRAAAIAELVLWIGYLQWHFRTRGQTHARRAGAARSSRTSSAATPCWPTTASPSRPGMRRGT